MAESPYRRAADAALALGRFTVELESSRAAERTKRKFYLWRKRQPDADRYAALMVKLSDNVFEIAVKRDEQLIEAALESGAPIPPADPEAVLNDALAKLRRSQDET